VSEVYPQSPGTGATRPDAPQPVPAAPIAATYERVSLRKQSYGFSLTTQERTLAEHAAAEGWQQPDELHFRDGEERDASGSAWNLPGLTAMLAAARDGQFQILLTPDLDRFARSLVKGLVLEEQLAKHGVRVVYQRVPIDDTTPEGRMMKRQLLNFAEYEKEKIALRTSVNKRTKAMSGRVVGTGLAPFGYRKTYETLPDGRARSHGLERDPVTNPIAERLLHALRQQSASDLASELNAEGLRTQRGKRWTARAVIRLATNPVYIGQYFFGRNDPDMRMAPETRQGIMVPVPATIDRATWDAVQVALTERRVNRRGRRLPSEDASYLRGRMTCAHCLTLLHTGGAAGKRYYTCGCRWPSKAHVLGKRVCDLPSLRAERVEEDFIARLAATLGHPARAEEYLTQLRTSAGDALAVYAERVEAIERRITAARAALDNLAEQSSAFDAGSETFAAYRRQMAVQDELIAKSLQARSALGEAPMHALTADQADGLRTLFQEVGAGLAGITPGAARQIVERLDLRATVARAEPGAAGAVELARGTWFVVEWRGEAGLRLDSGTSLWNYVILLSHPDRLSILPQPAA